MLNFKYLQGQQGHCWAFHSWLVSLIGWRKLWPINSPCDITKGWWTFSGGWAFVFPCGFHWRARNSGQCWKTLKWEKLDNFNFVFRVKFGFTISHFFFFLHEHPLFTFNITTMTNKPLWLEIVFFRLLLSPSTLGAPAAPESCWHCAIICPFSPVTKIHGQLCIPANQIRDSPWFQVSAADLSSCCKKAFLSSWMDTIPRSVYCLQDVRNGPPWEVGMKTRDEIVLFKAQDRPG